MTPIKLTNPDFTTHNGMLWGEGVGGGGDGGRGVGVCVGACDYASLQSWCHLRPRSNDHRSNGGGGMIFVKTNDYEVRIKK